MALRVLPRSLFARLMVAVLAAVGITLLIIVAMIMRERREFSLLGVGGWSTAQEIAEASESLARLPLAERDRAEQQLRQESLAMDREGRRRGAPPRRPDAAAMARAYARRIERELGDGYAVSVAPSRAGPDRVIAVGYQPRDRDVPPGRGLAAGSGGFDRSAREAPGRNGPGSERARPEGPGGGRFLDVTVTLPDGDQLLFRAAAPLPGPSLQPRIFGELALLTVLLAVVLYLTTRSITQPLSDLARAAESVGRGERQAPLPERGAREVREATRAFNTMQERLHRYLDSRTRVLAAMSHDLRTPLTRLRLRAESITDPKLKARFATDLEEMNGMVQSALGLFRDLNDQEPLVAVDVDALLRQLQADFAVTGGEVLLEGSAGRPLASRPGALKRCLANLLQNAIQYGVRAHVTVADSDVVTIRVRDDGPGIPEDAMDRVFDPFFRVEPSRNRDTGGTGLGLCIARDIAQSVGGTITLRNVEHGGLEVTVTLPRTVLPEAVPPG